MIPITILVMNPIIYINFFFHPASPKFVKNTCAVEEISSFQCYSWGIATMWLNLKQKISDELSTHVIKILFDLSILNNIPEIGKRSLHDQIFTELNDKFYTCISNINSTFTAKLSRINNNKLNREVNAGFSKINTELNSKLTTDDY
ncbi:hypothetical protein RclHR1_00260006 [Rhizophagus clarus]|uniref:Uncharacterized protein n=1 Tax=Rhizophagus clarus TaxID=94130 RepID=A0A2Z6RFI6_9GLOM|nr:hypothetical protein RclHR1_00260006 [Rhizophagus clarus]